MIYKLIGILIICAAGTLAYLTFSSDGPGFFKKETSCIQLTPAQQLAQLIKDDFTNLEKSQTLPSAWASIASIEVRMNSQLARAILGKDLPRFQRVKDGKSFLELEFMDLPDEENPGVIVQASLFDIKSKNKIFEIGRTYTMDMLNKPSDTRK